MLLLLVVLLFLQKYLFTPSDKYPHDPEMLGLLDTKTNQCLTEDGLFLIETVMDPFLTYSFVHQIRRQGFLQMVQEVPRVQENRSLRQVLAPPEEEKKKGNK